MTGMLRHVCSSCEHTCVIMPVKSCSTPPAPAGVVTELGPLSREEGALRWDHMQRQEITLFLSLSCRSFPFLTWSVTVWVFATRLPATFTFLFLKSSLAQCSAQLLTEDTPAITDSAPPCSPHSSFLASVSHVEMQGLTWCRVCASANWMWGQIIYIKILECYRHCFFFNQCRI